MWLFTLFQTESRKTEMLCLGGVCGGLSGVWSSVWAVCVELCLVCGALSGRCVWSSVWCVELCLVCGALSGQWLTAPSERKFSFSETCCLSVQCVCVDGDAPSEQQCI